MKRESVWENKVDRDIMGECERNSDNKMREKERKSNEEVNYREQGVLKENEQNV